MARDVDFNLTASDKSGPALSSLAAGAKRTQDRISKDTRKSQDDLWGSGLVQLAGKASPKLAGAIVDAATSAAKAGGPALAGMGAAAAPIIAGTLSAAIIGGAGIGGVIGGVALVKDDPRVAAAGAALGKNLTRDLKDFARPFVEPVIAGAGVIEKRFDEVGGNLRNIFANSSKFVVPLTDGVARFAQGVIRGVDALTSKGAPVIDAISDTLARAGTQVEGFLTDISSGADGAAASMRQLGDLFGGLLSVTGSVVNGINQVSGALDRVGLSPGILQLIGRLNEGGEASGTFERHVAGATGAIASQGQTASFASQDLRNLEAAARGAADAEVSLYGATTNAAAAIASATTAIKANGEGLSLNSEKGRENRQTLASLAGALNQNYNAYVAVNGAGQGAQNVLNNNREAFIRVATAASGSAAKARQLANDLLGIPDKRQPKVELLDNATGKINNVINRLAAVRSKTVSLNIAVRQSGDAAALRKQSLPSGLSAASHFAQAAGDGSYRTGGPTPVQVSQQLQVSLDGRPFYDYTAQAIRADRDRAEWRQKVGPAR